MSTASFDNIQPSAGGTARNAVRGIAAAWANLNGTGTIALRDSENVSSVVDNGTGNYSYNFANEMLNIGFAPNSNSRADGVANLSSSIPLPSASTVTTFTTNPTTGGFTDANIVSLDVLGDLA